MFVKLKKRIFTIVALALVMIFAFVFFLLFPQINSGYLQKSETLRKAPPGNEETTKNSPQNSPQKINRATENATNTGEIITPMELHAEVWKTFNASEASRSKLLLENPGGGAVGYLIGVKPPTIEEVERIRAFVTRAQNESKQLNNQEREEFDKWLGKTIDEYDPFGVTGKKVALIRIPDDPKGRTAATVYSTDDFEREARRFQGLESNVFQMQSPRVYVTEPGQLLDRFEELIKYPGK